MTIDEAIKVLHRIDKCNKEHYDDCYSRCCEDCEYYYDDEEIGEISLQIADWLEELKEYRDKCNIPLRIIATKVMERQKNYSEDTCHYFMKGVQAMVIAIEKEIAEQMKEGAE